MYNRSVISSKCDRFLQEHTALKGVVGPLIKLLLFMSLGVRLRLWTAATNAPIVHPACNSSPSPAAVWSTSRCRTVFLFSKVHFYVIFPCVLRSLFIKFSNQNLVCIYKPRNILKCRISELRWARSFMLSFYHDEIIYLCSFYARKLKFINIEVSRIVTAVWFHVLTVDCAVPFAVF
jgi:hypothetical protein